MKRFLVTSGILFGLALLLVVAVFVYLSMTLPRSYGTDSDSVTESATTTKDETMNDTINSSSTGVVELSEDQKERIKAHGFDPDRFVITEAMVECVQKKVGQDRIDELLAGAEPTLLELGIAGLCANAE